MFGLSKSERTDPQTHREIIEYATTHESIRFAWDAFGIRTRSGRLGAIDLISMVRRACEIGNDFETELAIARRRVGGDHEKPGDAELLEMDAGLIDGE